MHTAYNAVHLYEFLRSSEGYKNFITFKSYDVTKTSTQRLWTDYSSECPYSINLAPFMYEL